MLLILGIDPGRTTGLALLSINEKKATLVEALESKDLTAIDYNWLLKKADHIVCEDFKVRPLKARKGNFDWSNMETPKIIGSIQTLSKLLEKTVILQQPSLKPMGYGFAHLHYTAGKKGLHIQDAAAHAMYFAVKNNLCLPSKLL